MVYIYNTTIPKLMDHSKFKQSMTTYLRALGLSLGNFVNLESLGKVLKPSCSIVHKVSYLQACLIFCLFLIERELQVSECKLLIDVKVVQRHATRLFCGLFHFFRWIENLRWDLTEQGSFRIEDVKLFEQKRRIECCDTLALFSELHI